MAGRTRAQMVGLDAPTTEDAPAAMWGWIECGCGSVFYGPATRTRCMTCRTGAVVVREVEDDEEGQDDMRGRQLGLDEEEGRTAFASGMTAAEVCRKSKVSASQFAHWCYRNHLKFPGVPTPNTAAVAALQAEIDRLEQVMVSTQSPAREVEAPAEAAREVQNMPGNIPPVTEDPALSSATWPDHPCAAMQPRLEEIPVVEQPCAPLLPNHPAMTPASIPATLTEAIHIVSPFRQAVREGGLVLPIRIEGSRIVLREPEVEGDITEVEAAHVLAWLRGWLQERGGVEVVVEPCA